MYLLTKKIGSENNLIEDVFDFLIKSNYSKESLLKYKSIYLDKIHKTKRSVDLGNNIRNMLCAITFRLISKGYRVVSRVRGKGDFELFNETFELFYCELIIKLLNQSFNKTIYNYVRIKGNQLVIKIIYKDAEKSTHKKRVKFFVDLTPSIDGKQYDFKDYYLNRLSAVSLSLI